MSFVDERPPPGWAVSKLNQNHQRTERLWWSRCVGKAHYRETRELACRQAWESWALDILGDRVEWVVSQCGRLPRVVVGLRKHPVPLAEMQPEYEFDHQKFFFCVSQDANDDVECEDPVELLARLAAAAIALHGEEAFA